jgi:hypothetical protein
LEVLINNLISNEVINAVKITFKDFRIMENCNESLFFNWIWDLDEDM